MKTYFLLILTWAAYAAHAEGPSTAQKLPTVSGYVKDAQTGEMLIGATIAHAESGSGTVSNFYGYYSLSLPEGSQTLRIGFLGYETLQKDLHLSSDLSLTIELQPSSATLKEVRVVANQSHTRLD